MPGLVAAWRTAVDLGGQGYVAVAAGQLVEIQRQAHAAGRSALMSLAASTEGSLLRQAGRHGDARRLDAQALTALPVDWSSTVIGAATGVEECWPRAAVLDALIGLAADNLGLLRFAASERLLGRAAELLVAARIARHVEGAVELLDAGADWDSTVRCVLRWHWVAAELGLYRGDPAAGLRHARDGLDLVGTLKHAGTSADAPLRHRIKTELIYAGALAGIGEGDRALEQAGRVAQTAQHEGLLPLRWAALALSSGLVASTGARGRELKAELGEVREELRLRGMPFGGVGR